MTRAILAALLLCASEARPSGPEPYLRGLWQGALIGLIFGALLVWGIMR